MPQDIKEVKAKYEKKLMALSGVVSVGIGLDEGKKPIIIVGLDQPNPETEARARDLMTGHPFRVQVIGEIKAQ